MIQEAFFQATEGRPGPAILHFPSDLGESFRHMASRESATRATTFPHETEFTRLREILMNSHHPVIIAGADLLRAMPAKELLELAETIEAAVLVTMDARGVFPESHPRWAGVYMGFFNPNVIETRVFRSK